MENRKSMLDVIKETLEIKGKIQLTNRIVYVASLSDGNVNKKDLFTYYENLFEKYNGDASAVTGFLLVYPSVMIHFVESTSKVLGELLNELMGIVGEGKQLATCRIIAAPEDIFERAFPTWSGRALSQIRSQDYEHDSENPEALAVDTKLCAISDPAELETTLDLLRTRFKALIPSPERLQNLVLAKECPQLGEFVTTYFKPISIDLQNEIVGAPV